MLHICLCDDNRVLLEEEKQTLLSIASKHNLQLNITLFPNGESLLFYAEDHHDKIDIIFLDILMGELNGIETANQLRALGCDAHIIFVTSSREHVFESFDSTPLHYLVKDQLSAEQIEEVFLKAVKLCNKREEMFTFKRGSSTKNIVLHKIQYFEIIGRIMTIHFDEEIFEYYKKIDELEAELTNFDFCRIHRSFIVNLRYVSELSRSGIKLMDGTELPIGRSYYPTVKKTITSFLCNED